MFGLGFRQIFFLVLMGLIVFAGTQYIPAIYRIIQFEDAVHEEVTFASSKRTTTEKVRENIVNAAHGQEIPIGGRDILITRRGPAFSVEIDYSIAVNLRLLIHRIKRHVTASGEVFENDRN
jgi:hypothetical protein